MIRELVASLVLGVRQLVLWVMGGCGWVETALYQLAQRIRGPR